jgi:hypothetical protein
MPHGLRASLVIGLASAVLLASTAGCGNTSSSTAPSAKPKDESKESKPPKPDPG